MKKDLKKKSKVSKPVHVKISAEGVIPVELKGTSSVSINRAASGGVTIGVKVYDPDPDKASKKASKIYKGLKTEFPV